MVRQGRWSAGVRSVVHRGSVGGPTGSVVRRGPVGSPPGSGRWSAGSGRWFAKVRSVVRRVRVTCPPARAIGFSHPRDHRRPSPRFGHAIRSLVRPTGDANRTTARLPIRYGERHRGPPMISNVNHHAEHTRYSSMLKSKVVKSLHALTAPGPVGQYVQVSALSYPRLVFASGAVMQALQPNNNPPRKVGLHGFLELGRPSVLI